MQYRTFGSTDLQVSEIGFGAWAIGGPAMAGDIPIGWGEVNDKTSTEALKHAMDLGVNFYDTADFYGLGHSEELLGDVWGNRDDVIIASKVGHRLGVDGKIQIDYSASYIIEACEASLKRLKRETIDFYQLHTAKVSHFQTEACVDALELLKKQGKIRYWGLSLNTYNPAPEAEYLLEKQWGSGFQLVLNVINQRALPIVRKAGASGLGIIARMPLQFGLLTGKFTPETTFAPNDHRSFRLTPTVLETSLHVLKPVWEIAAKYEISHTELALSYILSYSEVSTVIPGMKNKDQVQKNTTGITVLKEQDQKEIERLYSEQFEDLMQLMEQTG